MLALQIASCNVFVYRSPEIANFKNTEVNEPGRLYTLQEMKGHLTCAIDVLSNPDESDVEKRLDAVRTLNSLVAALSVNDGDHYDVIDTAFEEIRE